MSEKSIEELEVSEDFARKNPKLVEKLAEPQRTIALFGLIVGVVCVLGGLSLFFAGITGSANWTAKFLGFQSTLTEAAPGVILFVVGVVVIWITRLKIVIK